MVFALIIIEEIVNLKNMALGKRLRKKYIINNCLAPRTSCKSARRAVLTSPEEGQNIGALDAIYNHLPSLYKNYPRASNSYIG